MPQQATSSNRVSTGLTLKHVTFLLTLPLLSVSWSVHIFHTLTLPVRVAHLADRQ